MAIFVSTKSEMETIAVVAGGASWNAGNAHHRGSYNPNAITSIFELSDRLRRCILRTDQTNCSDTASVYWLTNRWIDSPERRLNLACIILVYGYASQHKMCIGLETASIR